LALVSSFLRQKWAFVSSVLKQMIIFAAKK